jgi:hypothetical protein
MLKLPFVCPVAGISNYQQAASHARVGDRLLVEPDPDNPYDPLALAIRLTTGDLVGYIPKALAARLANDGAAGCLSGTVDEVFDGHDTIGLRVRVHPADIRQTGTNPDHDISEATECVLQPVLARGTKRPLGTLVRVDEQTRRVLVQVGNGSTVSYPAGLVELSEPSFDETAPN